MKSTYADNELVDAEVHASDDLRLLARTANGTQLTVPLEMVYVRVDDARRARRGRRDA